MTHQQIVPVRKANWRTLCSKFWHSTWRCKTFYVKNIHQYSVGDQSPMTVKYISGTIQEWVRLSLLNFVPSIKEIFPERDSNQNRVGYSNNIHIGLWENLIKTWQILRMIFSVFFLKLIDNANIPSGANMKGQRNSCDNNICNFWICIKDFMFINCNYTIYKVYFLHLNCFYICEWCQEQHILEKNNRNI